MNEQELFLAAVEIQNATARRTFLKSKCGDDSDLLKRVQALLDSHHGESQFLDSPVVEQLVADPRDETAATMMSENDPTQDDQMETERMPPGGTSESIGSNEDESGDACLRYLEASSKSDSIGRLAHYEIQEVIGRGAFGTVLKAFDEKLHRVVAIKMLAPEMAATSPARKRFLREARSSAAVRDDNVVAIYAVEESPLPYLVMEYIPGKTLQQRLDEQGPLDLSHVLRLGKQIADGLAAAHAEQLIHRDVKPGNILLETSINDHVKITDFGLARAADDASMTQSGMIAGTPLYMAPEQALGQKLDQRADLFSLGSVLYQMLTGRPPFRASNTLAVLKRVTEDTPRPIQEIIPEIPEWMCTIVERLHAKDPDKRYASATEVSDVLEHCLSELQEKRVPDVGAAKAAAIHPVASPATPSSRRPLQMVAATVVILFIGLGITESTGLTHLLSGTTPAVPVSTKVAAVPEAASSAEIRTNDVPASPLQGADDAPPLAAAPFDADMAKQHQQAWADHLGLPVEKEIVLGQNPDGTDVNLTMVLIPPGEYLMGTNDVDKFNLFKETKAANPEANLITLAMETPQHFVRITKPFWLSKYEFTTGQFRKFVEGTHYQTDAETNGIGGTKPEPGRKVAHSPDINWDTLNKTAGDVKYDHGPVTNVSWNDAATCCKWLSSQQADMAFSLPTEAQWEYACRAGTTTPWYGYESSESLAQYAQFEANVKWSKPGGRLRPNAFGLHDMHGNVWEWCHDRSSLNYYKTSPTDDPPGAADVGQKHRRACRGGSFARRAREIRSASRAFWAPEKCFFDIGFRVAAEIREPGLPPAVPPAEQGKYALLFDGENASVQTPIKLDVRKPFTVEAIITLPIIPDEPTFVVSDLQTGGLGFGPTPEGKLQSSLNAGKNGRADHHGYKSVESGDDISTNTPIHVAATFDGQILTLFVNGKMQKEQRHFDTTFNSPLTVMLGANPNDNGLPNSSGMFSGAMREIRISNTVRYDAHFTPATRHEADEHTLALYHCDEHAGDQLLDHSGNNNHGQIVGATWVRSDGSAIDTPADVDSNP